MSKLQIFLFFVICFSLGVATERYSWANNSCISCADTVIVIDPFPIPDPNIPRSPALVPISASYEPLLSSIILSFTSNLGVIEVDVLNTTTGGYDCCFIDTQFLSAIIPILLGPGHYIITFTLPSGRRYQGEFDV